MAKGYVMTFAFFIGRIPLEVLNDFTLSTNTTLIYAEVDVVLPNRNTLRNKLSSVSKEAAKHYLKFIERRKLLAKMEGLK